METEEQHEQVSPSRPSPGTMLRTAREKQGLSQQAIADKLFIKPQSVDDIENDKVDPRISITFTKGYVKMYAKLVGLDDKGVIAEFEKLHSAPEQPANFQSFSRKVNKQAHDDRWMMVTYVILFLLIAGVVGWWYQQSNDDVLIDEPAENLSVPPTDTEETFQQVPVKDSGNQRRNTLTEPSTKTAEETQQSTVDTAEDRFPSEDEPDELDDQQNSTPVEPQRSEEPAETQAVEPQDPVETDDASASTEQTVQNNIDAEEVELEFTFGEDCWVNINDATGEVIATGIKKEGRVMTINGIPPFDITLGAPDLVSIRYNGEPVDISFYQNGRTARITLPY